MSPNKEPMSAPWIAPLANSPQAVGLKNGGLSEITSDILYPASRLQDGDFQSGRTLEWRWRADSSRHFLPRESRMFIEYEFAFGETGLTGSGTAHNKYINLGRKAPQSVTKGARPNANIAMSAAPNAALFDSARFVMNSVTLENQPNYYDTAAANLMTKTDRDSGDTSGSGMLNSLRKDHGRDLTDREGKTDINFEHARELVTVKTVIGDANTDGEFSVVPDAANASATVRRLSNAIVQQKPFSRDGGLCNPKTEILQMSYDLTTGKCTVQVSEPLFLSTWQHPYAIPACDFQLFMQVSRTWLKDLLWCSDYSYGCHAGSGGLISPIPASAYEMGQIYCSIKRAELHAAYISPLVASIPPSIGIKYSNLSVQTVLLNSATINEQIVVSPACRAVYVMLRQRYHNICACREELGRAGGGFNEMVTALPPLNANGTGQPDARYQGRAVPHNLATLAQGTADNWIRYREGGPNAAGTSGETDKSLRGLLKWTDGAPTDVALQLAETFKVNANSKIPLASGTGAAVAGKSMAIVGDNGSTTVPTVEEMEKEACTHITDLQVQLGSAVSPKIPYSQLDPTNGNVSREWSDYLAAIGKPLGLRGCSQSLSEYCGWDNANGPSFPRNGNRGPVSLLRILNPPNSLSNVLQIRGQLAPCKSYAGVDQSNPQTEAQMELVVLVVSDNLMTVEWQPPAEIPLRTATAPIV